MASIAYSPDGYTLAVAADPVVRLYDAEGCRLLRDIPKDQVLTDQDIERPEGRLCDKLRAEQDNYFKSIN